LLVQLNAVRTFTVGRVLSAARRFPARPKADILFLAAQTADFRLSQTGAHAGRAFLDDVFVRIEEVENVLSQSLLLPCAITVLTGEFNENQRRDV
jgi:hypothetical protein